MKEHYGIFALIGLGGLAVVYYLMRSSASASASSPAAVVTNALATPSYPNSSPIQLGDVEIGGSPTNITYNQVTRPSTQYLEPAPFASQNCECNQGKHSCEEAGVLQSTQKIPQKVYQDSLTNLNGYYARKTPVAAPRVTFSQAAGGVVPAHQTGSMMNFGG